MNGSFRIGTIYGIPVLLHWSFLLIIPFFAWIIGSQILLTSELIEQFFNIAINKTLIISGYTPYILGTIVALGLFLGVFIHEMAHSVLAKGKGIKINSITLLIFGGISSMEEQTPDPEGRAPHGARRSPDQPCRWHHLYRHHVLKCRLIRNLRCPSSFCPTMYRSRTIY